MGEGIVLTTLLIFAQSQSHASQNDYDSAIKAASQAAFIQSGMKDMTDETLGRYERKYREITPEKVQTVLGWSVWVAKTVQDGKITYRWSF
jgi:hypothetical protein